MNLSFYSAASGAAAQQTKLDIIANNVANVNTSGYKVKTAKFSDLLYENIREPEDNQSKVRQGSGAAVAWTGTNFEKSSFQQTGGEYDFAIDGNGLFAVKNMATEEIFYTRSGNFHLSQRTDGIFYLTAQGGELVLDTEGNPIAVLEAANTPEAEEADYPAEATAGEDEELASKGLNIGIFDFSHREGFVSAGSGLFLPAAKNGEPIADESSSLVKGYIESSNVDMAREITGMIETQRLYQMNIRMVQTSDEIEGIINGLR